MDGDIYIYIYICEFVHPHYLDFSFKATGGLGSIFDVWPTVFSIFFGQTGFLQFFIFLGRFFHERGLRLSKSGCDR